MHIKSKIKAGGFLAFIFLACGALVLDSARVSATVPYVIERVNLTPSGTQTASGNVQDAPTLSQDGRYVAFATTSSDIVAGDTNGDPDIFIRDRKLGATVRANLDSTGAELSAGSCNYTMSGNGRFVLFTYRGSIDPHGTNSKFHLYLRDLKNNTTEMVSLTALGGLPNESTGSFDISVDGRYVVFSTRASNIVSGDTNSTSDVFIRDRKLGTTTVLSKTSIGTPASGPSFDPAISCDGSYVTFSSTAADLVAGDTNTVADLFLVDRVANNAVAGLTIAGNGSANAPNITGDSDISCNGERVVFASHASNLVTGDTNNVPDIFAYNIIDSTFQRVNLDSAGNQTNSDSVISSNSIDFSGRYAIFMAYDDTLVSGDTNGQQDLFLRDLVDGTTQIISKRNATTQTTGANHYPALSLDGREAVFISADTGLVPGDTNSTWDVFVSKTGI